MSPLDPPISIPRVSSSGCINPVVTPTCSTPTFGVDQCLPTINNAVSDAPCVNSIVLNPWPTPPPVDIGCSPVDVQVINTEAAVDDPDQTMRLIGEIEYLDGDLCLPVLTLNLIAPFNTLFRGGSDPDGGGGGGTTVEPTPCEKAASFSTASGTSTIGPILAEITSAQPVSYYRNKAVGWQYRVSISGCVISNDQCYGCFTGTDGPGPAPGDFVYNIRENGGRGGYLSPGVDLDDMFDKGYTPNPVSGQVVLYGHGARDCNCGGSGIDYPPSGSGSDSGSGSGSGSGAAWFFDVSNGFSGECTDPAATAPLTQGSTQLPRRTITSAGEFFGVSDSGNRV